MAGWLLSLLISVVIAVFANLVLMPLFGFTVTCIITLVLIVICCGAICFFYDDD